MSDIKKQKGHIKQSALEVAREVYEVTKNVVPGNFSANIYIVELKKEIERLKGK